MVFKRPGRGSGSGGGGHSNTARYKYFKRSLLCSIVRQVIRELSQEEIASLFEPLFRRVLRGELERSIQAYLPPSSNPSQSQTAGSSKARDLELRFLNKPASTIFTFNHVKAEDGSPIQIALFDARSQSMVKQGPLASLKIELCALDGEFGCNSEDDWTEQDFKAGMQKEREGKRPLLAGALNVQLKEGVGYVSDILLTDNSSWTRSRKFRLGATVTAQKVLPIGTATIREARSEPFMVKDQRGVTNRKHFPPVLKDDIWRLVKISKDGKLHKKLSDRGIHTVKDFLRAYIIQPSLLNEVFVGTSKKLEGAIVAHAQDCVIDDNEFFSYHSVEHQVCLIFNSICRLVGVVCDDGQICSPEVLPLHQKCMVEQVQRQAYTDVNNFIPIDASRNINLQLPSTSTYTRVEQYGFPQVVQQISFPAAHQDLQVTEPTLNLSSPSTSYTGGLIDANEADHQVYPAEINLPVTESIYERGESSFVHCNYLAGNENYSHTQFPLCFSTDATWEHENPFYGASNNSGEYDMFSSFPCSSVHILGAGRTKAGWCKIRAAVKCGISLRRNVANKRVTMSRPLYYNL